MRTAEVRIGYLCAMTFTQRFTRYLIGIFIGVLLSFVFFGQRSCTSWMPSNRVRAIINEKPLRFTDEARCLFKCYGLPAGWAETVTSEGSVAYGKSEPRETPQRYFLEERGGERRGLMLELRDSAAVIIAIEVPNGPQCACGH